VIHADADAPLAGLFFERFLFVSLVERRDDDVLA
jgi:hypothetical protein